MVYQVAGSAASGEEAVKNVGIVRPVLVLMDIVLTGPMDGIMVAELRRLNRKLQNALDQVKTLQGMLPICA